MARKTVTITTAMLNELLRETGEKQYNLRHKVNEDMEEINWKRECDLQEIDSKMDDLEEEVSYKTYNGYYKNKSAKEIKEEIMTKMKEL